MSNKNDSYKLVDIGCGKLIPSENLNPNQPGSLGSMLKSYNNVDKTSNTFYAGTPYGFVPGFTANGKNYSWGSATFQK